MHNQPHLATDEREESRKASATFQEHRWGSPPRIVPGFNLRQQRRLRRLCIRLRLRHTEPEGRSPTRLAYGHSPKKKLCHAPLIRALRESGTRFFFCPPPQKNKRLLRRVCPLLCRTSSPKHFSLMCAWGQRASVCSKKKKNLCISPCAQGGGVLHQQFLPPSVEVIRCCPPGGAPCPRPRCLEDCESDSELHCCASCRRQVSCQVPCALG